MTQQERLIVICDRVDNAITRLRAIRRMAQKCDIIGIQVFDDLNEVVASLKHNVEMHDSGIAMGGLKGH